ncbi:MAG: hypothetical protein ACYDHE_19655 [Candidatus Acidiferrales bacterium]
MNLLEYLEKRRVVDLAEVEDPMLIMRVKQLSLQVCKAYPHALVTEKWERMFELAKKEAEGGS